METRQRFISIKGVVYIKDLRNVSYVDVRVQSYYIMVGITSRERVTSHESRVTHHCSDLVWVLINLSEIRFSKNNIIKRI